MKATLAGYLFILHYAYIVDVLDFDFDLPPELIAQQPATARESARLLVVMRPGTIEHRSVADLSDFLREGDVLVLNNTRVFPARLLGRRVPSGGAVECLLIGRAGSGQRGNEEVWEALMHPGQRLGPGAKVVFEGARAIHGEVLERRFHGRRLIRLSTADASALDDAVDAIGHVPLPPYIRRSDLPDDRDRYQTVFARQRGSVAAPTAGLHLTRELLTALARQGVTVVEITLHVGYGTFQPVRVDRVEDHRLEPERYEISDQAAAVINRALDDRRRVIAVGTTTTRTLEAAALAHGGRIVAGAASTNLFIYPGFQFRAIGGLLTNFHLPRSSLLMLVSAFAGREQVLQAYRVAVADKYRFYSYGDAMLIL